MSEEIKAAEGKEESFEELLNQSFKTLNTGEKVTGIVTAITPTEVQVDVGAKQAAYIKLSELTDDPTAKAEDIVHVGDEIETYIVRVNDVEGYAELSKKRLDAVKVWENIEQAVEDKAVLEGTVTEENKGGIVVSVKGVRVFVPASQSGQPRGADLSSMIKQKVQLRITEVNRARRRVVGSIRSVADEARKAAQEAVWSSIEVGKHYTGTVKSMTSYGVFVDIGGVDGMVHISELSWSRIKTPSEVCKVGDTLDVYVISFDPEKHKISLGVKDRTLNPWDVFMNKYSVGDVASVRIVKLMTFGAFAEVVPGVDGLIHISQIADRRIDKPEDVLSEGQIVDAKITAVDEEKKKISLGVKDHSVDPWQMFMNQYSVGDVASVRIVKLMTFGAFAEVVPGVDGLIHISQIADRRIDKPEDVLSEGQVVDAKIIAVDEEKKKISLSIRALLVPAAEEAEEAPVEE